MVSLPMLPKDLSEFLSSVVVFETVHSSSEKIMIKTDLLNNFTIMHKGKDGYHEKCWIRVRSLFKVLNQCDLLTIKSSENNPKCWSESVKGTPNY